MPTKDLPINQDEENEFEDLERDLKDNPHRDQGKETVEGVEEALKDFLARGGTK